jgi:hypothetical protein
MGLRRRRQTAMFAAGVGLGASKGAEIGKHPEGYAGYLSKGKDMVSALRIGWGTWR